MILTLCIIFIILVFAFVKIYISIENEKRIKHFTLENRDTNELSFTDNLILIMKRIIKKMSTFLNKSAFLKNYALKFDKYLIYNDNTLNSMDYISSKFLFMFLVEFLFIFTTIIRLGSFNIYTFMLASIVSFFFIDAVLIIKYNNEKRNIEEQLLQAIVIMNSAFKSGKNITEAITIVKKELGSPIKEEFEIISKDISYGLSLDDAFNRFYNRIKVEEAKYITSSLSLLSKTGGNIVTVFNMIEKNFYDRLRMKNELASLTASSKLLYRMLLIMPFIFIIVIVMLNPTYFTPLVTSSLGYLICGIMILIYTFYCAIIRKIMKVDEV